MRLFRKKIYLKQKHLLVILICALVLILLIGFLIIRRIFFPKSVYFSQTSVVMYEGQKKVYGAKTEPKLPFGDNINYVSSNSKVATVSQNGTITAKSAGETEIVATHDLSKKKASLKVTVEPNTIIIDLAEDNIKILKGQTHKINATITESGNAKAFIKYSSSDTSVAQVDSEGLITGIKGGKTTIKIFDEETQSSKEINVEIISQLENITFSSDSASIEVGESFSPAVLLSPEDTSDKSYTLSITPENIAEIKDGKITGLSSGTATLTATHTLTNKTDTMKITVSEKVKSISLSFVSTEIRVGKTTTISAKVLPDAALDKSINWTTSDPSVAAVWGSGDSTATIKGVSKGTCKIRATSINNPSIYAESTITVTGPVTTIPPNETNTETYIGGILIVNKTYGLPKSYNRNGGLTAETQAAFNKMKAAAKANGISLWVASGYRSYERQKTLFESYLNRPNSSQTDVEEYSARPGFSEHQTGMAIDVNSPSDSFYGTPEQKWLDQHCAEYGFIIRYPKDKQSVTGYKFEPWHIRYVGVDNAKAITNAGLCLEEYLGVTSVYANKNY